MCCMRTVAAVLIALGIFAATAAPATANIQPVPELLVRLWPFFRAQHPVPLWRGQTPSSTPQVDESRPLIAPFVPRKLDINSASFSDLQNLPGITSSMAARIFAGRPYRNLDDLRRDDIPSNVVQGLAGQVVFGP